MFMLLLLVACPAQAPTSHEQCAALASAPARDECYVATLPKLFCTDAASGIRLTEEAVSEQLNRDFIWLRVTGEVDPATTKYCDRIKDEAFGATCRKIPARPHMNRERTDALCPEDGKRGQPGLRAPPPGGKGSPGPPGGGAPLRTPLPAD